MKGSARHYSVRFNTAIKEEQQAVEILDRLLAEGWSLRQILTDALLRAGGVTPEMFGQEGRTAALIEELQRDFASLKGTIHEAIAGQIGDILVTLRNADPDKFRQFAQQPPSSEIDEEFASSMGQAIRRHRPLGENR